MCSLKVAKSRNQPNPLEVITDPFESAKSAGLRYVSDARPGIQRKRSGKSFRYFDASGTPIRDKQTLTRIRSLVIPPAWQQVWICPINNGHLQATGRDAKGRKQSRYHPRWREVRDETKYERMMLFGRALPAIREHVDRDLALPNMQRSKILATIVRLMETTFIRIGNEEYARGNHSYGLTTMRNKHVAISGSTVHFEFPGKSGVRHSIDLSDRRLARIVKQCRDLPGYELFQYVDESGERHTIDSADVNDYLREIAGDYFTAKDFRTWAGTVLASAMLRQFEPFDSETQAKKNVVEAIKAVAKRLGNTPSVCRKCYVHPAVIDSYIGGKMMQTLESQVKQEVKDDPPGLREEELALMRLLHRRLLHPAQSKSAESKSKKRTP
jgi:DNA topoisomerase-1